MCRFGDIKPAISERGGERESDETTQALCQAAFKSVRRVICCTPVCLLPVAFNMCQRHKVTNA